MRISPRLEPISHAFFRHDLYHRYVKETRPERGLDAWIGPYNWPQRACVEVILEGDTLVEMVAIAAK